MHLRTPLPFAVGLPGGHDTVRVLGVALRRHAPLCTRLRPHSRGVSRRLTWINWPFVIRGTLRNCRYRVSLRHGPPDWAAHTRIGHIERLRANARALVDNDETAFMPHPMKRSLAAAKRLTMLLAACLPGAAARAWAGID